MPYSHIKNVLSVSLNKTFPSFLDPSVEKEESAVFLNLRLMPAVDVLQSLVCESFKLFLFKKFPNLHVHY